MMSPLLQLANQLRLIEKLYCDQLYSNYVDQKVFDVIHYLDYRMRLVFAFDNWFVKKGRTILWLVSLHLKANLKQI